MTKKRRNFQIIWSETYDLSVDYGRSVEEAIRLGHYDYVADFGGINSDNFPTKRKDLVRIYPNLVHCDEYYLGIEEFMNKIDRMDYHPDDLHELLAFGEKYPDVQRKLDIVAGSGWQDKRDGRGNSVLPCLKGNDSRRGLHLRSITDISSYWFLVSPNN